MNRTATLSFVASVLAVSSLAATANADPIRPALSLTTASLDPGRLVATQMTTQALDRVLESASPELSATRFTSEPTGTLPTSEPSGSSESVSPAPAALGASIGEGGRDLVPRFKWVGQGANSPFVCLEIYGDAGPQPTLLDRDHAYVRANPVLATGFSPTHDLSLYAGLGAGGSLVGASSTNNNAGNVQEQVAITGVGLLGARYTGAAFPMVFEWRADAVAGHGVASMLNFAMEIAR